MTLTARHRTQRSTGEPWLTAFNILINTSGTAAATLLEVAMTITVDVLPARALADEPFTVVLSGLTPRGDVTIEVQLDNCLGGAWRGTFSANAAESGVLALAAVSLKGFAEPDPTTLLWAAEPDGDPNPALADAADARGTLTVMEGGLVVAVHEFTRVFQ